MSAYVVIGANYGDEGKGLMTDYLARKHGGDVTRFNGGSQAGHTVVSGKVRNVFNMWSSGTLAGARTRAGKACLLNPIAIFGEADKLKRELGIGVQPMYVFHGARVSTPFDAWLNQEAEVARGNARHGSCGLGINETVVRTKNGFGIEASQLGARGRGRQRLIEQLNRIIDEWIPNRSAQLGISTTLPTYHSDRMLEGFLEAADYCAEKLMDPEGFYDQANQQVAIYEGAQGLALDEHLGFFPYVTRSVTGVLNAAHDLTIRKVRSKDIAEELEVIYVSRMYLTRHGAGPLPTEAPVNFVVNGGKVVDKTNHPNTWQGTIRYGCLHLPDLARRIYADLGRTTNSFMLPPMSYKPVVALTCLDQGGDNRFHVVMQDGDEPRLVYADEVMDELHRRYNLPVKYFSSGPSADDVQTTGRI